MAMGEVFKLFGTLGINTKPADDALDKTTGKAKDTQKAMTFQKKVDDSIVKAGNSVLAVGGILAGVAATAATFALKGGITRALNIENAEAKLRGLGHAGETVDVIMSNALASVKGTAFGLDAAATTAANAVAAGIKPGTQLEGVLKTVANSAALAGADMGEMGAIFNKVATSNKVQMDVINQLHDRGIPALQFLANEMGVTAEKASEMASKGEIDFETFARAMDKGVGTAAVTMGDTVTGSFSNMQAAASRVGAAVVKDIMPVVKDFFQGFTAWLDENSGSIVEFVSGFISGFTQIIKWIGENETLVRNIAIVIGALLIPALMRYIQLQTIAGAQALIMGAKMMAGWLMAMGPIGLIIAAVVGAAALIIANWEWIKEIAITVWTAIVQFFTGIWQGVVDAWTTAWSAISSFFTGVWNGIVEAFKVIWDIFMTLLTIYIGLPLAIINTILIQPLIALWTWAWGYISQFLTAIWEGLVTAVTWYINLVLAIIKAILDVIVPIWTAAWDAISSFFKMIWDGIVAGVTWYINTVMTIITTVMNIIKGIWDTVWGGISTFFKNVWNGIVSFLSPIINTIRDIISNVFNGIKNTVTNIFNAIKSAIEGPINAAKDIVKKAIDMIKGFFSFKIEWPKIPMPKFGFKPAGWKIGDLLKGTIPSLDVSFHKKGGLMNGPSIFGMNGNEMMVGGEAGPEAILPLTREVLGKIGHGIADTMGVDESVVLEALLQEIKGLREDQKDLSILLDSGELVGAIRKKIDQALEKDSNRRRRGVTP